MGPHQIPMTLPLFFIFFVVVIVVVAAIEIGIVQYVSARMGIHRRYVFLALLLCLLGSYVNIQVARLPPTKRVVRQLEMDPTFSGVHWVNVVEEQPGTVIAVNLGGAVIPVILSLILLFRNAVYLEGLLGVAVVTVVVHMFAQPQPGVGITMPFWIAPLVAAGTALLISHRSAPAVAYIAGTLGTLIGADLLNLYRVQSLHATVAAIGGAGTFDGIFVTGLLAVLLA